MLDSWTWACQDSTCYCVSAEYPRHDEGRQIYLVALTGYGQSEDRLRSVEAGFRRSFGEALDVNQLAQLLQRAHR